MRLKTVIGMIAIMVALAILGKLQRDRFYNDIYVLCLGAAGDGPVVTEDEMTLCTCMADRAVDSVPWTSLLPPFIVSLSTDDKARIAEAQKTCRLAVEG